MRVVIMQPSYFPWMTYIRRVARADLFIILDHVALDGSSKTNFVNRVKVLNGGKASWLTIPVNKKQSKIITELTSVSDGKRHWGDAHADLITQAYRKHPHAGRRLENLSQFMRQWYNGEGIIDVLYTSLRMSMGWYGVETTTVLSSSLPDLHQYTGSELILKLCEHFNATSYIAGKYAADYLCVDSFANKGVRIETDTWTPAEYHQLGSTSFVQGLSCIDAVMNYGTECRDLLELPYAE